MKRQKFKIISSILLIIILFSFDIFSAIVSDSDGSAFVTKAEFDALKESFNGQIDSYNISIDSKIDGAIASYLAGMRLTTTLDAKLFYPVNSGVSYTVKSVKPSYNEISEQYFNNIVFNMTLFAHSYNNIGIKPWDTDTPDTTASKTGDNWILYVRRLSTDDASRWYTPTMRGFVFDHTVDSEVITHYYKNDIINIVGNLAVLGNGGGGGRRIDVLRIAKDNTIFNNKKLNELFSLGNNAVPGTGINAPANSMDSFLNRDTININNYWPTTFNYSNTSSWGWKVNGYDWTHLADSWMLTNTTGNEDKNIYLYNYCDAKIYAHDANEVNVESFEDMSSVGGFSAKNSNLICDSAAQESFAYGNFFDGKDGGTECMKGYWWLFPKIRLKNTYVTQTDKWNNLKQFKNGYLSYQSISGGTKYPRYYGGLPLLNISSSNPLLVSGNINIAPTSTSYTNANMKLWIKDGEFKNDNNIAGWTQAEKDKFKTLSAPGCTFDNNEKCLLIPKNTNIKITINNPKKNEEYFLRFSEVGNTYGGEIKYLDDFVIEMDN